MTTSRQTENKTVIHSDLQVFGRAEMFINENHRLCWSRFCPPCQVFRSAQTLADVLMNNEKDIQADQAFFYHLSNFILANRKFLVWTNENRIWKVIGEPIDSEEMKSTSYAKCALLVSEVYASNAIEITGIVRLHAKTTALENQSVVAQSADGKKTIITPMDIPKILKMYQVLAKRKDFILTRTYDAYLFIQTLRCTKVSLEKLGLTPKIPGYDLLLDCYEFEMISKIPLFIRRMDRTLNRETLFCQAPNLALSATLEKKFNYSDPIFSHLERFFLDLMLTNSCNLIRKPGDSLFSSSVSIKANTPILFFDKSFYCLHDKSMKEIEFYRSSLNMAATKGLEGLLKLELQSCFLLSSYSSVEKRQEELTPLYEIRKKRKVE